MVILFRNGVSMCLWPSMPYWTNTQRTKLLVISNKYYKAVLVVNAHSKSLLVVTSLGTFIYLLCSQVPPLVFASADFCILRLAFVSQSSLQVYTTALRILRLALASEAPPLV